MCVSRRVLRLRFGGYVLRMVSLEVAFVLQDLKGDVLSSGLSVSGKRSMFAEQELRGMDYFGGLSRVFEVGIGV